MNPKSLALSLLFLAVALPPAVSAPALPSPTGISGLRASVAALVSGGQLTPASAAQLTQILDLAALRVQQGQYGTAASLLRTFNAYVSRFVAAGSLAAVDGNALLAQSAGALAVLNGINVGLAAHWKMDEGSGSSTADASGNGKTAFLANGPAWVPGKLGKALSFNGVNNFANAPTFFWPSGGPVSVSFWNFAFTNQVSSAFTVGSDNTQRFQAHVPWVDNNLYWDYGDLGSGGRIVANYSAYLSKWTHVVLVSAGLGGNFKAIYLDGVLVAADGAVSLGPTFPLSGADLGRWSTLYHPGSLDDFRIYNRVLSAAEVAVLAGVP